MILIGVKVRNAKTIRYVLACALLLILCAPSGCKKEDKPNPPPKRTSNSFPASPTPVAPPQSQAKSTLLVSLTDRNAEPTVLASPPPDMFDLKARPDASILTRHLSCAAGRFQTRVANAMAHQPDWKLTIAGHTDNIGGHKYNVDLSQRRSASVKRALVERYHFDPNSLSTSGHGDFDPIDTNETLEGRARNRRVELTLD